MGAVPMLLAFFVVLVDGLVNVPKARWTAVALQVEQPATTVDVSFTIPEHVSRIQVSVVSRSDAERFHQGRSYRPVCSTGFQRSAKMRCLVPDAGEYVLLLDNRLDARFAADVSLKVETSQAAAATVRTLSRERKIVVITLSLLFLVAVVMYSARQLMR